MENFVSYVGYDEVIICTSKTETQTIKDYFGPDNRNRDDYYRTVSKDVAVSFSSRIHEN